MNKWRGINWSLHPLFVIILLMSALTGYFIELICIFVIVLVHELGHVFMAHAVGWKVTSVKLLPFGGVVEVTDAAGKKATDELLVAISGPLQNGWMILIALAFSELGLWSHDWASYFIEANIWIACFNLLPVLPLDGGKIVQALLSYRLSYYSTLLWTARISIGISVLFILYAIVPLLTGEGSIKLNEGMIGTFLLLSNLTTLRHIPFLIYRFILYRNQRLEYWESRKAKQIPIIVDSNDSIYETIKRFHRERLNVLCVIDRDLKPFQLLSERTILNYCLDSFDVHRAVGDILR